MSGTTDKAQQEREKYVRAFNSTMIKIWREQIALLGVVDTGALYRSTVAVSMTADGKYTSIALEQSFNLYGLLSITAPDRTRLAATPVTFRASESRAELAPTMPSAAEIVAKQTSDATTNAAASVGSAANTLPRL